MMKPTVNLVERLENRVVNMREKQSEAYPYDAWVVIQNQVLIMEALAVLLSRGSDGQS
jgi:hypothetical protein